VEIHGHGLVPLFSKDDPLSENKKPAFRYAVKARRMRTDRIAFPTLSDIGAHKRRAALSKVKKAKVRLSYGHDGASFVMDALIILPSGEFVNRHFAILQKKAKPRCGHPAERGKSMGASKIVFFDFITFRQQIRSKIQKSVSYNIVTMKRKKQEYYGKQHV
jgi:hypothetical protein